MQQTLSLTAARFRAERLLVRASCCLRAVQLAVWIPAVASSGIADFRSPGYMSASYLAVLVWSVVLYTQALRRNMIGSGWVMADVAVAVIWLITSSQMCLNACTSDWQHWVIPSAMGTAVMATMFAPVALAVIGLLAITGTYLLSVRPEFAHSPDMLGSVVVNGFFLIGFPLLAYVLARWIRGSARDVDSAASSAIEARSREAAARARSDERSRQFDGLHQTVLSTLNKIACGGLDHRADEVRRLCARDADYLRNLVTSPSDTGPADFVAELATVVRDKQALGLRVHSAFHQVPPDVPPEASTALLGAVREALNNVSKHAGTAEAWVTAVGTDGGGVRLSVVDRGAGFEVETVTPGRGLVRDLHLRIIQAGGTVDICSDPGAGTAVELSWAP